MKKADKKELARLRRMSSSGFCKLKHSEDHDHFKMEIEFLNYLELSNTAQDLLKLCINSLSYSAKDASPYIRSEPDLQLILELILQLWPSSELSYLDELRPFLEQRKSDKK